jgi:hypothetical protein
MTHWVVDVERAGLESVFGVLKHDFLGPEVECGLTGSTLRALYVCLRCVPSKWTDRGEVEGGGLIVGSRSAVDEKTKRGAAGAVGPIIMLLITLLFRCVA